MKLFVHDGVKKEAEQQIGLKLVKDGDSIYLRLVDGAGSNLPSNSLLGFGVRNGKIAAFRLAYPNNSTVERMGDYLSIENDYLHTEITPSTVGC